MIVIRRNKNFWTDCTATLYRFLLFYLNINTKENNPCYRTRPRLILESSPFTMESTKTVIPVNPELKISYKEPIAKDFTLHVHYNNHMKMNDLWLK